MLREPAQTTLNVIEEISPRDEMYAGVARHYFDVGRSALELIRISLRAARVAPPRRILDLPCGHGRVLRFLKAAFPDSELVACDLNRDGVDFCKQTFDAYPTYSVQDPGQIPLQGQFDLIWCGSLLTHLNDKACFGFLELFDSLLSPNGVIVFTTNGPFTAELLRLAKDTDPFKDAGPEPLPPSDPDFWPNQSREYFPLPVVKKLEMLRAYDECGFGYADYPSSEGYGEGYGLSISSPAWICRQLELLPALKLVGYVEHGWDDRQDVVACARRKRWFSLDAGSGQPD